MSQAPFGALVAALAALATALGFLAIELRADGYEQYVGSVNNASVVLYVAAIMVGVAWARDRRLRSG
ncbi:SCO3870 family protein [Streptomyces sp. XD-27]|uniref:SCO3870 family protein n=1 Tax=Streptomyces sp. XD-27 TaxID=3062779 RepID=UPI0026F44A7A|nr:SCO3870 family protein [Streptomyces sp. XD-27]WKX71481.1 SCO3870 family protein [Streptomyces sp. XD-27]